MAAPADSTMLDLNGKWQLDKELSNDPDVVFSLQGLSWLTRKALGLATVTLEVNEYKDDDQVVHLDISQTLTGGVPGTTERRITNWTENDHTDHIFGHVIGMSRLFGGAEKAGKVRPDVDVQTRVGDEKQDEEVARFLRGEVLVDGEESEGFVVDEAGKWLQSWVRSVNDGWTAEQVWGFEMVNGERRHSRRAAVVKDGQVAKVRLIYSYLWE